LNLKFFITLVLLASHNVMAKTPSKEICLKQGEAPTGTSMGRDKTPGNDCCQGLTAVTPKITCGKGFGGYVGICVPCGNGICEKELENNCNCPSDCKPE
jgi:hypothetical protein